MSFKLVDKIKKSSLPGSLKKVLEAYVSFGNADGTSIRPTADAVAERVGGGKRTVQRYTPTLVRLGFLVHDFNEDGTYKTYNYPTPGVWAYVYHADLSPLANPAITEGFEIKRLAVSKARSKARGTGIRSRQFVLFDDDKMTETPTDKLAETLYDKLAGTPYDKMADRPDPIAPSLRSVAVDQTQTDPSVVSTTVKEVSEQVSPSASNGSPTSSENESQPRMALGLLPNQDQNQPQTEQEFWETGGSKVSGFFINTIYPHLTDAIVREQLPLCDRIVEFFGGEGVNAVPRRWRKLAAEAVLNWNRIHRSGKYASKDDKKLYLRSAKQYLNALESANGALLNDYHNHEFDNCEVCKTHGFNHFYQSIANIEAKEEREKAAEQAELARRAEQERLAKLCRFCKDKPFGQMTLWESLLRKPLSACDDCYDARYEAQQRGLTRIDSNTPRLDPRPGYKKPEPPAPPKSVVQEIEEIEYCPHCKQESTNHFLKCPFKPKAATASGSGFAVEAAE